MSDDLLTTSGVALRLGIPESTIRYMHKTNKLKAVRDSAGRRLFKASDIDAYVRAEAVKGPKTKYRPR